MDGRAPRGPRFAEHWGLNATGACMVHGCPCKRFVFASWYRPEEEDTQP